MHLTHPKAGSTWLDRIFRKSFGSLVEPRGNLGAKAAGVDLKDYVYPTGRIHPALFLSCEQFLRHQELADSRRFVVIRDLRDTIISLYFSVRYSHPPLERIVAAREQVRHMEQNEALLHYIRDNTSGIASLQRSWVGSGEHLLHYEDLLKDDVALLTDLFIQRCGLPITPSRLKRIILLNRFEARFGRKLGTEDIHSHGRQGAPGNWRKYFTRQMAEEFQERYGEVLVATGYERDETWVEKVREQVLVTPA